MIHLFLLSQLKVKWEIYIVISSYNVSLQRKCFKGLNAYIDLKHLKEILWIICLKVFWIVHFIISPQAVGFSSLDICWVHETSSLKSALYFFLYRTDCWHTIKTAIVKASISLERSTFLDKPSSGTLGTKYWKQGITCTRRAIPTPPQIST